MNHLRRFHIMVQFFRFELERKTKQNTALLVVLPRPRQGHRDHLCFFYGFHPSEHRSAFETSDFRRH